MCIIIVKKPGVELPEERILRDAWRNNPDGGGYMYPSPTGDGVQIKKGFMEFSHFIDSISTIKNIKDIPVVIHFRITTHGATNKANTHPFPLSSNIKELVSTRIKSNIGIVHNGIINISNDKKLSDTMQYIKDELSLFNTIKPGWYKDIKSLDFIKNRIGSKLAIMDGKGYIATVGEFYKDDGILYSNYSYIGYTNYGYSWEKSKDAYFLPITDGYYQPTIRMDCRNLEYRYEDVQWYLEALGLLDYEIDTLLKKYSIQELEGSVFNMDIDDILDLTYM